MKVAEKNRARNKKANTLTDALTEYGWFVFCKDFHLTGEVRDRLIFLLVRGSTVHLIAALSAQIVAGGCKVSKQMVCVVEQHGARQSLVSM